MQVKLKGKTLKGKNRVREHGEIWNVIKVDPQRGAFINALDDENEVRWVHHPTFDASLDRDFEVEVLDGET